MSSMAQQHAEGFYLDSRHFSAMVVAACLVHMAILVGYMMMPKQEVDKIPVHVLNIKLGSGDLDAMQAAAGGGGEKLEPRSVSSVNYQPRKSAVTVPAKPKPAPAPKPAAVKKEAPAAPKPAPVQNVAEPAAAVPTATISPYATASRPAQYVRSGSGSGVGGVAGGVSYGTSVNPDAEVMQRYTQQISGWVRRQRPTFYQGLRPGMRGNIIIRLQIDRAGNILHFKLDKATGVPAADRAAAAMVRAANPVPPVPRNYPPGNLFEFLVSVNYDKPRD